MVIMLWKITRKQRHFLIIFAPENGIKSNFLMEATRNHKRTQLENDKSHYLCHTIGTE